MKIKQQIGNASILVSIAVFFLGLLVGYLLFSNNSETDNFKKITKLEQEEFKLTSPLLDCGDSEFHFRKASQRKKEVQEIFDKAKRQADITKGSVYFLDLNSGLWFGIDEQKEFYSASLVKVFILITYLKEAEENPKILEQKLLFSGKTEGLVEQIEFPPELELEEGKEYTISELLERMIIYSDNDAYDLLALNREDLIADIKKITEDIEIKTVHKTDERGNIDILFSTQNFSKILRILYNATYLNHKTSEKALEILSRVKYDEGIESGVEEGTIIANKFGERSFLYPTGNVLKRQLHDCGIVYHEKGPYILCIMTQGKDNEKLQNFIKDVSHKIFTLQNSLK